MGIRDYCSNFTSTPSGDGCYRDDSGNYHYVSDSTAIQTNFQMSEFNTEGCHPYGIMLSLAEKLQAMRTALGVPITINSGYRNPPSGYCGHDSAVSSTWTDVHADGLAADIYVAGKTYLDVATAAHNAGFVRIEVIKASGQTYRDAMSTAGHVHVDVYDGSGNTTSGTMYDSPASAGVPAYPWYAYGVGSDGSYTTCNPNTWSELLSILQTQ